VICLTGEGGFADISPSAGSTRVLLGAEAFSSSAFRRWVDLVQASSRRVARFSISVRGSGRGLMI